MEYAPSSLFPFLFYANIDLIMKNNNYASSAIAVAVAVVAVGSSVHSFH